MKNSTSLRLFLICLGIPLTRASSPTLKPKTSAFNLSDTTDSASVVQLGEHSADVQVQEPVSGMFKGFLSFMYTPVYTLGRMFNKLQSGETKPDGTAAQPKAAQNVVAKVTEPLSTRRQPFEDIIDHSGLSNIEQH